jgi:cytosine/uracil/thiamine/allantoin permease
MTSFREFIGLILALLLVLVPWASINLIDFYLIKKGSYDIASIFRADGGIYGRFNPACDHRLLHWHHCAVAVRQHFAVRRAVRQLLSRCVDLSWLVGLIVTCPLYYCLATRGQTQQNRATKLGYSD